MNVEILVLSALWYFISLLFTYILTRRHANKKITEFKNIKLALEDLSLARKNAENELSKTIRNAEDAKAELNRINEDTKDLQELRKNDRSLLAQYEQRKQDLEKIKIETENYQNEAEEKKNNLHAIMSKIDLYSRLLCTRQNLQ